MSDSQTTIFISYSRIDHTWLERLKVHLGPLKRSGLIDLWDDTRIKPGMPWRDEIQNALRSARVAVLLISPEFMNSSFINTYELPPLLAAAETDGLIIIPLILSPSLFFDDPILSRFQSVNPNRPLKGLRRDRQDLILTNLCKRIAEALATPAPTRRAPEDARQTELHHRIARLNKVFAGTAAIHRVVWEEPQVVIEGAAELSPEERKMAERFRAQGVSDEPHVIVPKPPVWSDNPVRFSVRTLDFGDVSALRYFGKKPAVLSGLALCFCEATRELLLHQRAEDSATYPGSLHILGGGYMPPGFKERDDDYSLVNTARRELQEEAQVVLAWETMPPGALATELTTGFVQFVLLGVNLSRYDMVRARSNREGIELPRVAFDELFETLVRNDSHDPVESHLGWVPSGKAHVLAWLALGAPGAKSDLRFGDYDGITLFKEVMSKLEE